MMQKVAVLLLVASANAYVLRGQQGGTQKMQPDAVAATLLRVEDEWRSMATSFAECNASSPDLAASDCTVATKAFQKSCGTVSSSVVQSSSGDRKVVKEYMADVCSEGVLSGWHQEQCQALASTIVKSMTDDAYDNRESLDVTHLCTSFWTGFAEGERVRVEKETAERKAEQDRLAKERAEAEKKAAEEAAKKAEEDRVAAEAAEKNRLAKEADDKAAEAKELAEAAAQKLAEKKAEAATLAEAAKTKQAEAAASEVVANKHAAAANVSAASAQKAHESVNASVAVNETAPVVAAAPVEVNATVPVAAVVEETKNATKEVVATTAAPAAVEVVKPVAAANATKVNATKVNATKATK